MSKEEKMMKKLRQLDKKILIVFLIIYGISYAVTITPLVAGIPAIAILRTLMIFYILIDAIVRYIDLDRWPKVQAEWFLITFCRLLFLFFIGFLVSTANLSPSITG